MSIETYSQEGTLFMDQKLNKGNNYISIYKLAVNKVRTFIIYGDTFY